ncbi:MAG: DNA adenine methylase [Bacteroidaceae bacterium]|nr:DNA adenine methylase [Bacteroidaceae bacterium]
MGRKKKYNVVYNEDSRKLSSILPADITIQTTITSPPYFDMKDYGVDGQIGYGQKYNDYLEDLKYVFSQVYEKTSNSGTLWVIIDTFKRNNAIVALPFDLVEKLKDVGWLLQDIIIWKKDKTVPWSSNGFTQRKFEYILFFSKSPGYKNNKDRVRVFDKSSLKKWWVKYPERYNPKGKALDEIWEFPIPVQGSWGDKYIRHFCPLPAAMVSTMIQISTDVDDVVFDPFAGSGTVLSESAYMHRRYVGFELNPEYIQMFQTYLKDTLKEGYRKFKALSGTEQQKKFEETILNLRALKYGRILALKLRILKDPAIKILVNRDGNRDEDGKFKVILSIICAEPIEDRIISSIIDRPPLSKYEIKPIIFFLKTIPSIKSIYCYSSTNSHAYMRDVKPNDSRVCVISPIKVDIIESDYE